MKYPNRFRDLSYINVNKLPVSVLAGCLFNVVILISGLIILGVILLFFSSSSKAEISHATSTPVNLVSLPLSTNTPFPTNTPMSTNTPFPTNTPISTNTPYPTLTPLPTSTPFTITISYPTPELTSTPRLYTYSDLKNNSSIRPTVVSTYPFGFYRAYCVLGVSRIEPRVIGVPDVISGLHWRVWNDYGWLADTSDYEQAFNSDDTFFLSSDPSLFYLALYFYEDQISDKVLISYPGQCPAVQVVYLQAVSPLAENVVVSSAVTTSDVLTVTIE